MNGHEKNSSGSGTCTPVPLEQVTEQITKDFVSSSREPTPEGTPPDKVIRTPPHFSPRSDLLNQKPTKENAQSLFSQDCCVFVGNLSNKIPIEQLEHDLAQIMLQYGRCFVNIKCPKNMPSGFVQYEERETAKKALAKNGQHILHGRALRFEASQAHTTAYISLRSGHSITESEIRKLLNNFGELKTVDICTHIDQGYRTIYGLIDFAYQGDFAKALHTFHHNDKYYLRRAEMDDIPHDGAIEGDRHSNEPPQNRTWNNSRLPRARPYGNGHNRGHNNGPNGYNNSNHGYNNSTGNGNVGNGGNSGRGGIRSGPPRHHASFSNQHTPTQSINAQNNPSHGFSPRQFHRGFHFPPTVGGAGNFDQGYNPNVNQGYNPSFNQGCNPTLNQNFSQGYPFNNHAQHYPPQGYPPAEAFVSPSIGFSQMSVPEVTTQPFPSEYPGMPNPGLPIFMPNQYHPAMMTRPQTMIEGPPAPRPPFPNEPLLVSSQPQFDSDQHREHWWCPTWVPAGMPPNWPGAPGSYCMQPGYSHYSVPRASQPSLEAPFYGGFSEAEAYESTLNQIHVEPTEGEEIERGRSRVQQHHSTTDGSSDMPQVAVPGQTKSEPLSVPTHVQEGANIVTVKASSDTGIGPTTSQDDPIEPENNPNEPEPEAENTDEPSHAPAADEEHRNPNVETVPELEVETKSAADSSEGGPDPKTPDTDQSRERVTTSTKSQPDSRTTVTAPTVAKTGAKRKSPVKDKGANAEKLDNSKSPAKDGTTDADRPDKGKSPAKDEIANTDKLDEGKSPAKDETANTDELEKDKSLAKRPVRLELDVPKFAIEYARKRATRTPLRENKPLKEKYQPQTGTRKTVEDYTRETYRQMVAKDPSFQFKDESKLDEAIQELEDEWYEQGWAEEGLGPEDESPDSGSPKDPKDKSSA